MNETTVLNMIAELTDEIMRLQDRVKELEANASPTEPANPFIPTLGATLPAHAQLSAIYGGRS